MERWYARKHHVANKAVAAATATSKARYTKVGPQWPPTRTAFRIARAPQLTGLNFAIARIQPGISATVTRIDERNISGMPTKFAAAIIDASRRISSAIPCEKPANT